jgi:hypothetical protein
MTVTNDQLASVLKAAETLLGARQDSMDTVDEWAALARAVATCTGRKTGEFLTAKDLRHLIEYDVAWNEDTDGALPIGDGG